MNGLKLVSSVHAESVDREVQFCRQFSLELVILFSQIIPIEGALDLYIGLLVSNWRHYKSIIYSSLFT